MTAVRTLVVACADWPLTAAGVAPDVPAAVVVAQRVVAASPAARAAGVLPGLRRRLAQGRCPDLVLVAHDPLRDAVAFEPVAVALEQLAPGVEIVRPGLCALAAAAPARYAGGDDVLAAQAVATVDAAMPAARCRVAIADGPFAAELAATTQQPPRCAEPAPVSRVTVFTAGPAQRWAVVPAGRSRQFLAPYAVDVLGRPAFADLLHRLGVHTLGDLAALPSASVVSRFGPDAALAHRLARGLDARPVTVRTPPPELTAQLELDPPAAQVEQVLFAAKGLADRFSAGLAAHGLTCQRISIEAETEHGERLARLWRHDSALTAAAIVDRVRWQLDGWLSGTARFADGPPTGGLALVRLVPDQVSADVGRQLGLWGAEESLERVARALARVQGVLGPDAVTTPVATGGRDAGDRVTEVRWGDPRVAAKPVDRPWPGTLPTPAPATVLPDRRPAQVVGADGGPIAVDDRCEITAAPARVCVGGRWLDVVGWGGPWPALERWWDPHTTDVRSRFQLATDDGGAWLVTARADGWWLEAVYD